MSDTTTAIRGRVFEELLIRGDGRGGVQGAHVVWLTTLRDGEGRDLAPPQMRAPEPVALAVGQPGCPLAEVLEAAHLAALGALEAAQQEAAMLREEVARLADVQAEVAALREETARLRGRAVDPAETP